MIQLTAKQILEYYDVPQLFLATDTMSSNYICMLYNKNDAYDYLAVKMSDLRLRTFLDGKLDLRAAYLSPEQDDTLYHVTVKNEVISADCLLKQSDITEDMLPEVGFYFDNSDAVEYSMTDSLQIDIPVKDRGFVAEMAKRMGWPTKILSHSKRIAVL